MNLKPETIQYAYPGYPWQQDQWGCYFPDAVLDPFLDETKQIIRPLFEKHLRLDQAGEGLAPLNRHRILISNPELSWTQSADLVIDAFTRFDPQLGSRAQVALNDPECWLLCKTDPGEANGSLKDPGKFYHRPFIAYDYDGTINDAVYIAHELGHLFESDIACEIGGNSNDSKIHLREVQAYFTQHILYEGLTAHSDLAIRRAGHTHFIGEVTRNLYDLPIGIAALAAARKSSGGGNAEDIRMTYRIIMQDWLGDHWKSYEKAGRRMESIANIRLNTPDDMEKDFFDNGSWGPAYLHRHPMASIVAMALYTQAAQAETLQKSAMLDSLYGVNGPQGIIAVLSAAGIKTDLDLAGLAKTSLSCIAAPLQSRPDTVLPASSNPVMSPSP